MHALYITHTRKTSKKTKKTTIKYTASRLYALYQGVAELLIGNVKITST